MSESLSQRAIKNALYGFIGWFLPVFLSFLAARILVHEMGVEEYGFYSLILGLISYLFVFNIGRAVTKHVASSSPQSTRIISATFFLCCVLSVFLLSAIVLLSEKLTTDVLQVEQARRAKVISGLHIAAGSVFFLVLGQTFVAVIYGLQRFDVYSKINTLVNFLLILGNIGLAITGHGFLVLLWWNFVISFLSLCVFYLLSKRLMPEIRLTTSFGFDVVREVIRYGGAHLGYQVLANALFLFERAWIMRNFGASNLTYYVLPMMVGIQMHFFVTSFNQFAFPMASEIENDKRRLIELYTKGMRFTCLVVIFLASFFVLQREEFLGVWLGANFIEKSANVLILHVVTYSMIALVGFAWQVFDGVGMPQLTFLSYFLSFVLAIASMLHLGSYGIEGVAAGRLLGTLLLFALVLLFEKKVFNYFLAKFWLFLFARFLVLVAGLFLIHEVLEVFGFSDWLGLLSFFILASGFYAIAAFALRLITLEELNLVKRYVFRRGN